MDVPNDPRDAEGKEETKQDRDSQNDGDNENNNNDESVAAGGQDQPRKGFLRKRRAK